MIAKSDYKWNLREDCLWIKYIEHEQKSGMDIAVPVWQKAALTVEEAAAYSNIGITKLYEITNNPVCSFVLHVGNRKRLIKRKEFEKYLSQSIEI